METSIEVLNSFHSYTERIGAKVGLNVIVKYKLTPTCILVLLDAVGYMFVNLNSAWYLRHNIDEFIYCILTAGYDVISLTMIIDFIRNNQIIMDLYEKAVVFHLVHKDDPRFEHTLNKFSRSLRFSKIMLSAQIVVGILGSIYPLPASLYYNELVLTFGFHLPFLDSTSATGFTVNLIYQNVQIVLVACCFTYIGNLYMSFILQVVVQYDGMIDLLNELKVIGAQNWDHRFDVVITKKLKIIIREFQEQLNYIRDLEALINKILLVQIMCTAQTTLSTLYVLIDHFWVAGFLVMLFSVVSLFVACALGTMMESSADAMMHAIYDTTWYQFSIKDQKLLQLLLAVSQNPHNLTFGGQAPLHMKTFLDFYKRIYSFYMMLRKAK